MTQHKADWAVIFDMDGVLVDSAPPHFESWQQLAREEGITVTRQQFEAGFGRQNRDIIPMLFGAVSSQRLEHIARRKEQIYRDIVRHSVPGVPGAAELVKALARERIPLAIGSAGPRENIELILEGLGVAGDFAVVISGDDVSRGKPDPLVFSVACERLSMPPGRCVVIEDAVPGVVAAKAAGTKAAAVMMHYSHRALKDAGADVVVDRLSDLTVSMLRDLVGTPLTR